MSTKPTEQELQETAAQLAAPHGENGLRMGETMNEKNALMIEATIARLELQDEEEVLELGPGNGDHLKRLLRPVQRVNYHGLEVSVTMQEEARRRSADIGGGHHISFSLYDGRSIPFGSDRFNKIFTVNTLYFWEDPEELLAGIWRSLRPGGTMLITYGQKGSMTKLPFVKWRFRLYDNDDVVDLFARTGLPAPTLHEHHDTIVTDDGDRFERRFTIAELTRPLAG